MTPKKGRCTIDRPLKRPHWDHRFNDLAETIGTEAAINAMHALHGPRDTTFPEAGEASWRLFEADQRIGVADPELSGFLGGIAVNAAEARRLAAALVTAADWIDKQEAT